MSADRGSGIDRAAAAGIHPIPLWTPFAVGPINAYLLDDEPLTLIDSGPNSARSMHDLEIGLEALGHQVDGIGLLVLSHHHMDHIGLAEVLAARSGAEIAALADARPYVEDFAAETRADNRFAERLMLANGVPPDLARSARAGAEAAVAWGASGSLSLPLEPGGELRLRDHTLAVDYRPGHSPTDTVLVDRASGIAFTGDHLIAGVSSNPLITRPLGSQLDYAGPRPQALLELRRSLRQTRASAPTLALTGHGAAVDDVVAEVDARLASQERRAQRTLSLIAEGPTSAHQVARSIWGELAIELVVLTLCEVLGHVDLLIEAGVVRIETSAEGELLVAS